MDYVDLGTTGQQISRIAFGCYSLGFEAEDQETYQRRGREAVRRAFELGINLFDTAESYGPGRSEQVLAAALQEGGIRRNQVLIASKCGILFPGMEPAYTYKAYDASPDSIRASCEGSLRRLGTDYIDLYQIHRIDYLSHPQETARALEDLRQEGKIRWAGVSNYTADEVRALAVHLPLQALQVQFSLLHLEPLETGLQAVCLEKQMNLLAWSPLHLGVLTGERELDHGDWQVQREEGVVRQLQPFARKYGLTPGQLALAWLLQLPGGVVPLVGTVNAAHIAEAAAATEVKLARDDWYELLVIARGRPIPFLQRPYAYLRER